MIYNPDHPARSIPALGEAVGIVDDHAGLPITSPAVANRIALDAAHRGYLAGLTQARQELKTADEVAEELGLAKVTIQKHAQRHGFGWKVGRAAYVFTPQDIENMRALSRRGRGSGAGED